jgi:PII-like signaling protein
MKITEDDVSLRIYVSERERLHGIPMYEAIVLEAKRLGLAGATVLRGVMGFGADRRMHSAKFPELDDDLPFMVEIIDSEENIGKILPFLDANVQDGFVTMETVHVTKYRHGKTR